MEAKAFYIKRLLATFGVCVIGLVIAEVLFGEFPPFEGSVFLTTVLFAGMPFGWMALQKVFGGILVWGFWGILIYGICMIALSMAIGWMILCYRLIRDIVLFYDSRGCMREASSLCQQNSQQ